MDGLGFDWKYWFYNDRVFLVRDESGLWRVMNHGECVAILPTSEAFVLVRALEVLDGPDNT